MNTDPYIAFADSMDRIRTKSSADTHLNQLLFANVITAFEFYLQTIAVGLMNHDALLVKKVAETNKFKNQKVALSTALTNDMKQYAISLVQNIVFHNLAEVEPLFREAWNISIPITPDILGAIRIRHDIVHRNGCTKQRVFHTIEAAQVLNVVQVFDQVAHHVDKQVLQLYGNINTL
jgi:hypothetical protein